MDRAQEKMCNLIYGALKANDLPPGNRAFIADIVSEALYKENYRKPLDRPISIKCGICGGGMSENPHPDTGKPPGCLTVGTRYVCIPCTVKSRHEWAERAMKAEGQLENRLDRPEWREKEVILEIAYILSKRDGLNYIRYGGREIGSMVDEYLPLARTMFNKFLALIPDIPKERDAGLKHIQKKGGYNPQACEVCAEIDIPKDKPPDTVEDGFGTSCSAYCPKCGEKSMYVVRPGDIRCAACG